MAERRLLYVLLLLFCLLTTATSSSVTEQTSKQLRRAQSDGETTLKTYKNYRWYINLPPFLYNMCALYYVVPDCLDEMFGEEFDMASLVAEVCPI